MPHPAREAAKRLFGVAPDEDDEEDSSPAVRAVTLRLDFETLAYVDAMAARASVSRNVMLNELVGVGVSSLLGEIDDDSRVEIEYFVQNETGAL